LCGHHVCAAEIKRNEVKNYFRGLRKRLGAVMIVSMVLQGVVFIGPTEAATQNAYRWRNDDGSESTATYALAENTALTNFAKNTSRRLRFGVAANSADTELLEKAALTLNSGENQFTSAVIDTANGYAYFGTRTSPGIVVKVALGSGASAPTRIGAVTLNSGENTLLSAAIDTTNGYAYFGTDTSPGIVVKVALGAGAAVPTRVGAITLNSGENQLASGVIDPGNGYAYFGTSTSPGYVVKVALGSGGAAPARTGVATFLAGEYTLLSAAIDTTNGYAYFGTYTSPGTVVKVSLGAGAAAPSKVASLNLNSGENLLYSVGMDATNGYAYFSTYTSPGRVVKVALGAGAAAPTRTGAAAFNSGENLPISAAIDTAHGYAYFGLNAAPATVVKVALGAGAAAPSRSDAVTFGSGKNVASSAVIDTTNGHAYFGTYTSPGIAVKISASAGAHTLRLEYGGKVSTCSAISSWTQVAASPTTEHFAMSNSANITNAAATTDSAGVTNGGSTFTAGAIHDTTSQTASIPFTTNLFTEVEFGILATTSSTTNGNYCFRLTDAGSTTGFTYTNYAEATVYVPTNNPTLSNAVIASRLKFGASSTYGFGFTLQNAVSGTLTVTFPAGFTVTGALTSGSCSGGTVGSFGFTSSTLTAVKTGCTAGALTVSGAIVTNHSTPGRYHITWVNDDPGGGDIYIVDDDQVTVTANVDPTLTMNVGAQAAVTACDGTFSGNGGTVALGALAVGSVSSSDASSVNHICTRLSTNASGGAIMTVKSANGTNGLVSTSVSGDKIPSSTGTVIAGTARYGICTGSVGGDRGNDSIAGSASPTRSSPFNGTTCTSSAHDIGGLTTSAQSLWTLSSGAQNAFVRVYVKAAISPVTPAHSDYTDTLTFIGTGTF